MQHHAATAYQQTTKQTAAPRDLEANLLSRSAAQLQRVRDDWDLTRSELSDVLHYNRKLWGVFLTTVTKEDNPLPHQIKQNVANLGLFVMNHTIEVIASPSPQKLDVLININREIAAGLRSRPTSA
ncbi:flagellar biosynthesis regulator FlaF [Cucumibacter marinus]|uniref:flagellar biosynthesis regulator FlaF n=1 Tax=Cucumibacter marinus TaxID=1121252 RepID=UPI00048FFB68|nr:flagellar biosynthesis regulator FlaF [Cucumibacter marinus]